MKKSLILAGMLAVGYANAQEGNVGINTENPQATLDITAYKTDGSTKEGLLIPRLAKEAVSKMANPEISTLIYVTDEVLESDNAKFQGTGKGFYYYNGTKWVKQLDLDTNTEIWTNDSAKSVVKIANLSNGTTTRTNERNIFITDEGRVGVGIDTPDTKLDVIGIGQFRSLTGSASLRINAPQKHYSYLRFSKEDVARWDMGARNTEDTGEEVGSEFYIAPKKDDGSALPNAILIQRNTGNVGIGYNNPEEKLDAGNNTTRIAGRIFHRTTTSEMLPPFTKEIISVKQGGTSISSTQLETYRTYEIVLNIASEVNQTGAKYIVYHDNIEKKWKSKFVSGSNRSAKLGIAPSGNEIEVWHEVAGVEYHIRANIMSINNYSIAGTSQYNFGLDGAMSNLAGNVGVGTETPTEKLDVDGKIKATSLAGTGNRNVYADANGVLQVGEASSTNIKLATDTVVECTAANTGTMNFGSVTINGENTEAFGFCMKNSKGEYKWYYIYGGAGVTTGSGAFGSGL